VLDDLVRTGKLRFYGVSVEQVDEALKAIEYPNVQSVQIIFNAFRHKPADQFFPLAEQKQVGVLARVPLASGLLSGKMTRDTKFAPDDHRNFNQHGEAFDAGETFSGLGDHLDDAFAAVDELKKIVPTGATLAQLALRWILMFDGITCAIPGAKRPDQVEQNVLAADLPRLNDEQIAAVRRAYDRHVRPHVHHRW
jgi:aryl-alcohol dehydrogenase-like predicted oxidoreductase